MTVEVLESSMFDTPGGTYYDVWTTRRVRVPGGWIYTTRSLSPFLQGNSWFLQTTSMSSVLVPDPVVKP